MNSMPVMDGQIIDRDANGVVTIKSFPVIMYVVVGFVLVLGIGAFARGQVFMGVLAILTAGGIFLRSRNSVSLEINPVTRVFKINSGSKLVSIPFDDISGLAVATDKQKGNFTEEQILVVLNDNKSIQIGVITDANLKNREEKVARLMKFLSEAIGK